MTSGVCRVWSVSAADLRFRSNISSGRRRTCYIYPALEGLWICDLARGICLQKGYSKKRQHHEMDLQPDSRFAVQLQPTRQLTFVFVLSPYKPEPTYNRQSKLWVAYNRSSLSPPGQAPFMSFTYVLVLCVPLCKCQDLQGCDLERTIVVMNGELTACVSRTLMCMGGR